jgi:hypothetical protein
MHNGTASLTHGRWCIPWQLGCVVLALAVGLGAFVGPAIGQQNSASVRQFAPGVETTIPPDLDPEEAVSTHDLIEVRANPDIQWKPEYLSESRTLYGMSEGVKFRRDVWCLEFSFKPLRMIYVDVPQPSGKMQRKLVWYLVYRVKNTGKAIAPVEEADGTYTTALSAGGPVKFNPQFVLESHDLTSSGQPINKAYLDRLIPVAKDLIQQRELPGRELLTSVEMAEREIPVSDGRADRSVWGVATWEDVDPRIDFCSVYVRGLSNAYRWVDPPGAYRAGDPPGKGRQFERLTLQLNFWRPGDQFGEHESEIRFGVPPGKAALYGVPDGVAYRWIYR